MARAGVASASAHLDSIKGFAPSTAQRAYRLLLAAEPSLARAVPILFIAFLVTVLVGTAVQVLASRRQALDNSVITLDAAAEIVAERINVLKQTSQVGVGSQELLEKTLPAWATTNGRHFLLTNREGEVVAASPAGDIVDQHLMAARQQSGSNVFEIDNPHDGHQRMVVRQLKAPFGQLMAVQSRADALANWHSLATLTTALSTTTGCVFLILGFAFYWQVKRTREVDAPYRTNYADTTTTQLIAHMSHELRTPLNAIIGFSEIMETEMFGPLGTDKYREYCRDIHSSGQCLLQAIGDILVLSERKANGTLTSDVKQKSAY